MWPSDVPEKYSSDIFRVTSQNQKLKTILCMEINTSGQPDWRHFPQPVNFVSYKEVSNMNYHSRIGPLIRLLHTVPTTKRRDMNMLEYKNCR